MTKRKYWTGTKRAPAQDRFFIDALDPDLWTRGDADDWDACWHTGMPARNIFKTMKRGQWINHIPGNHALTVKSRLYQTLDAARRRAPADCQERFGFFPDSYLMPDDYFALQRDAFAHPEKRWIIKPKSLSRGRGIEVIADAGAAPVDEKMLVQEYLRAPHLFDGRKYVLRCYLAITSVEPLRVYLYKEGFVKLASEPYRDGDFDNLYAHLTNPDVNALNEAVDASVVFYSFADYRDWLRAQGADPAPIFDALRDIGAICAVAARETMRERLAKTRAYAPGCCELIGMDCMVDDNLKPWLLECNLSPSLGVCASPDAGGVMEEETKRAVVKDLVAMAGLNDPEYTGVEETDLRSVIAASRRETENAGGYELLFPSENLERYVPLFPAFRHSDAVLADAMGYGDQISQRFATTAVNEFAFDDDLVLQARDGQLMTPTTAGAYIWLRTGAGDAPQDIANDLAEKSGLTAEGAEKAVRDTVADWGASGLLASGATVEERKDVEPARGWANTFPIRFAGSAYRMRLAAPEIMPRIEPVVGALRSPNESDGKDIAEILILTGQAGYAISADGRLMRDGLRLSEIAAALCDVLLDSAVSEGLAGPALRAGLWRFGDQTVLMASTARSCWNGAGAVCQEDGAAALLAGACALAPDPCRVRPIALPARAKLEDLKASSPMIHQWADEKRGAFVPNECISEDVCKVDKVVLPAFQAAPNEAEYSELTGRDAFLALADLVDRDSLSADAGANLAAWVGVVPIIEMSFSDLRDGARSLADFLQQ